MNLQPTEGQKLLRTSIREFMDKEITPLADEYERMYGPLPGEIAMGVLPPIVIPFTNSHSV